MKINYQKELEQLIIENTNKNKIPSLLLHSCCAPCSSYCLEYLSSYFYITVFFYNPNIYPETEFKQREEEQVRFIKECNTKYPIQILTEQYEPEIFFEAIKGLEDCDEGKERCEKCYFLRLDKTARLSAELGYDYFTTTLSISPLKNAEKLNEIGKQLQEKYQAQYLFSDFKKKGGYQRSIELSKEFDLYRQDYCGCVFSRRKP